MGLEPYTPQDFAPWRPELLLIARSLHRELGLPPHGTLHPEVLLEEALQRVLNNQDDLSRPGAAGSLADWLEGHLRRHIQQAWDLVVKELHDQLLFQARFRWQEWRLPGGQVAPEDLVNGAREKATRRRGQFSGQSAGEYFCWLYRILENHARDERDRLTRTKKRGRATERSLDEALQEASGKIGDLIPDNRFSTPSSPMRLEERIARVRIEIERLRPEVLREVMILKLQERSYEEIAEILGVPINQVRLWITRAYGTLRERLQGLEEDV